MKAFTYREYGAADVLRIEELPKPQPSYNQILVKIRAASVNTLDWHFLRGKPFLVRMQFGFIKPKVNILGYDFSGIVEAAGSSVTMFKPGSEVFGALGWKLGAFAEYACIDENAFVEHKPGDVTFQQAASVPAAAVTALIALKDRGQIKAGQKVLINGSTGAVGTFSVQMAKAFGAHVTAVCSTGNIDLVKSLGADETIDYTREDFNDSDKQYDFILDNVGNCKTRSLLKSLAGGGTCVCVGFQSMPRMIHHSIFGPLMAHRQGKKWPARTSDEPGKSHAVLLKQMLEDGQILPFIDRAYPFRQLPEAISYVEKGHARGKVVISMDDIN